MAGEIIRRPDLEAMQCSVPGFVADKIYPFFGRPQIAGRIYAQRWHSDVQCQYNRDHAALAEITDNVVSANQVQFSTAEIRSRISMDYAQRMGFYDDEHADLYMGRLAKRSLMDKLEITCANNIFSTTGAIDGIADPVAAIDTQVSLLRDKGIGRVALVGANRNLVKLKSNATVADRMKATGLAAVYGLDDVRNVGWAQMAACFGVDEVIPMKDNIGYAGVSGASKDCVAVVVLPDEYVDPAERVILGNIVFYMFTDSEDDKLVMTSWVDAPRDANVVDAKMLAQVIEYNPELRQTIRIFNDNQDSSSSN